MTDTLVKQIDKTELKSASLARAALAVVLSALSGLFLMLAFPPLNIWPLMFVGLGGFIFFMIFQTQVEKQAKKAQKKQ